MTTSQYYTKVADVLSGAIVICHEVGDEETVKFIAEQIVEELGGAFELDNPNFDYHRFVKACGAKEVV